MLRFVVYTLIAIVAAQAAFADDDREERESRWFKATSSGSTLSTKTAVTGAPLASITRPQPGVIQVGKDYTLIAWNDLGMHCMSPRFSEICILPPYNTLRSIVIRKAGEEPRIVTTGVTVSYWMDNNVKVDGKTDFWTYAPKLFGKPLAPGIGLTGNGLTGQMKLSGRVYEASGVPVLPYYDNGAWQPYQRATVALTVGSKTTPVAVTSMVVPVSDELNCAKCHTKAPFNVPTLEQKILSGHDKKFGTKLMDQRPVLCASCHADAALGTTGKPGVPNLSLAMHGLHGSLPADRQPACFDCHPGAKTQCNRSAIEGMGPTHGDPNCAKCHGDLPKMASDLKAGRRPWVDLPTCAQCHGKQYSTGKTLYKQATGHGGVLCVACHNSPHAWWPSTRVDDNLQPMALQGRAKPIGYKKCSICHTDGRTGTMPPHGDDD